MALTRQKREKEKQHCFASAVVFPLWYSVVFLPPGCRFVYFNHDFTWTMSDIVLLDSFILALEDGFEVASAFLCFVVSSLIWWRMQTVAVAGQWIHGRRTIGSRGRRLLKFMKRFVVDSRVGTMKRRCVRVLMMNFGHTSLDFRLGIGTLAVVYFDFFVDFFDNLFGSLEN